MTTPVHIAGLRKSFGTTRALDGLDLEVAAGEIHGFVGPNGAGKSTTIRILLGLLRADSGTVEILDGDPWADAARIHRRVAYVPSEVALWPSLSGGEVLDLLGRLHGGTDPARRAELVERFALDERVRCRAYSTGNRHKVALVAALATDAELLILDEPTSGLDPLMERVFQDCLREVRAAGRTVLLSSHVLSEVEAVCDRVTVVRAGRRVEHGRLADLGRLRRVHVSAGLAPGPAPGRAAARAGLTDLGATVDSAGSVQLDVGDEALPQALRLLADAGVSDLRVARPTLEESFLDLYAETGAAGDVTGGSA